MQRSGNRAVFRTAGLILAACLPALLPAASGCGADALSTLRLIPPALANAGRPVRIDRALPYAEKGERVLCYDLYRPATVGELLPLIVVIYGNAWRAGSREQLLEFAYDFAANGYAAAAIDYRAADGGDTTYAALVEDVFDAVDCLRDRSEEIGIDPERVALFGASAGAHLALLAGLAEDASAFSAALPVGRTAGVRAVVSLFGPTDLSVDPPVDQPQLRECLEALLGLPLDAAAVPRQEASPVSYVRANGPAVFVVQGSADSIVNVAQGRRLAEALDAAGQPFQYIEIPGMEHTVGAIWVMPVVQSYRPALFEFLKGHL